MDHGAAEGTGDGIGVESARSGSRVALVHDWLVGWGGSESVLLSLARLFPEAPIYTSVWAPDRDVSKAFGARDIRTTHLQRLPAPLRRRYPWLLPFMPHAFGSLDLSGHDLVVSSSHAFSKAVVAPAGVPHVCYCHTPPRYLWSLTREYRRGLAGLGLRGPLLRWLRQRDLEAASRVSGFIANSGFVRRRIEATYGRDAAVVHPPVDLPAHVPQVSRTDRFVAGGRLVPYKRVDLAVGAATLARLPLTVFGDGPELPSLRRMAGPTVSFVGRLDSGALTELLASSRAFVFPGEEDFGILPVEAQAVGTPVIAYGAGGALETVLPGRTGTFFRERSVAALASLMDAFRNSEYDPLECRRNAARFSRPRFERRMRGNLTRFERPYSRRDPASRGPT